MYVPTKRRGGSGGLEGLVKVLFCKSLVVEWRQVFSEQHSMPSSFQGGDTLPAKESVNKQKKKKKKKKKKGKKRKKERKWNNKKEKKRKEKKRKRKWNKQ